MRVLFVDDEPDILEGLQNVLRGRRRDWQMEFALSGPAAIAILGEQPFDVIVSDMRMPGMDGAELLQHVKQHYPGMARIVLSGHAERAAIMRAVPVAHQFLCKPCETDALVWVVERTHSWMNRFRRILIRWEKKVENYFGLLHLVCAWITYRCSGLLG